MWSDSVQRVDYVEGPPGCQANSGCVLNAAWQQNFTALDEDDFAAGDDFEACEYCVQVRALRVCVVQLHHYILTN